MPFKRKLNSDVDDSCGKRRLRKSNKKIVHENRGLINGNSSTDQSDSVTDSVDCDQNTRKMGDKSGYNEMEEDCGHHINSTLNFANEKMTVEDLVDHFVNDSVDRDIVTEGVIELINSTIEESSLKDFIRKENEGFLKNIFSFSAPCENNIDIDGDHESEPEGVKLFPLMKSVMNESKHKNSKKSVDLIKVAKRKRDKINKEKAKKSKEEQSITFSELMKMPMVKENELRSVIDNFVSKSGATDGATTTESVSISEEDYLMAEVNCIEENEVEEILAICQTRDVEHLNELALATVFNEYSPKTNNIDDNKKSQNTSYECNICGHFATESFMEFNSHYLNHFLDMGLQKPLRTSCAICTAVVPQSDIVHHIRKHRDHDLCIICRVLVHKDDLKEHILAHGKQYKCKLCAGIYPNIVSIRKHNTHHGKGEYLCEECNVKFASLYGLVCHISQTHRSIYADYGECPYCFDLTDNIKNHIYSLGLCRLKCKICRKVFKTDPEMTSHYKEHFEQVNRPRVSRDVSEHNCHYCHLQCASQLKLIRHLKNHRIDEMYIKHFPKKPRVQCDICQREMLKSYLPIHMKKHDYYERCSQCWKLVLKTNIASHIELHKLDFKCTKCDEMFSSQKKLNDHEWAHGRLFQRPCGECDLIFNSEVCRVKHLSWRHKNIDPDFVECIYCKELLMAGIEYHVLDPIYCQRRCKLCDTRFKETQQYEAHVLAEHQEYLN